jgi:membrane-associated protease RseP (regulator of RpoE activity)
MPRWWPVHILLFCATVVTTTVFGWALYQSFFFGLPLDIERVVRGYFDLKSGNPVIYRGLEFSAPLLLILLAHELGHYLECRRYRVDATLPFFLPSPTLFGTWGAFIRIRSPIYSRTALFDIGVAGPIAGFLVLMPFLIAGIWESRVLPVRPGAEHFTFGVPILFRLLEAMFFPGVPSARIALHPVAMAAWVGLLATAFNLLPIGQLDGGHILYAVFGEAPHRVISLSFVAVLIAAGFFYWPWWLWAVLMFFLGRRHPLIYDRTPVGRGRMALFAAAVIMLVLSATVIPVSIT